MEESVDGGVWGGRELEIIILDEKEWVFFFVCDVEKIEFER
jgi:hypothetical protein